MAAWISGCRAVQLDSILPVAPVSSMAAPCRRKIVIPVITLREIENESAKTRAVEFSLLWIVQQGGDQQAAFRIHQNEPVSERVLARSVLVSFAGWRKR